MIFYKASSHISTDSIEFMKKNNVNFVLILAGMTPACQPLDISANIIFKDNVKLFFKKNCLDGLNQNLKLRQAKYYLIEHIYNVWHNDTIINKEIIMHGFKKTSLIGVYYTNLEDIKITELYIKDLIDSNFEIIEDLINDIGIDANEIENVQFFSFLFDFFIIRQII